MGLFLGIVTHETDQRYLGHQAATALNGWQHHQVCQIVILLQQNTKHAMRAGHQK